LATAYAENDAADGGTDIRPSSFRELLRHRGEEPTRTPSEWRPAERSLIEKRFREFLVEGGFPETQGLPPSLRIELLQGYVEAFWTPALRAAHVYGLRCAAWNSPFQTAGFATLVGIASATSRSAGSASRSPRRSS